MPEPLTRLRRNDTILLIVDMQERLVPAMFEAERVARHCATLAAVARRLNLPVVVTEQNPAKLGPTVASVTEAAGTHAPIAKMLFSACTEATLEALARTNRSTVLLCGIEAHVCVLQSALDLIERNFTVFVAQDAIASRQESSRKIGWERMMRAGAVPTSMESAIFELLREAGTADFRALLPLVK
ncbi:MAG TPA: hydrolase [Abditibacteriaceae bacterium]|nr:hydrolase [Abditibacteriaceae bacterium]